jgi:hypothetical protein
VVEAHFKDTASLDDKGDTIAAEIETALGPGTALGGGKYIQLKRIEFERDGDGEQPAGAHAHDFRDSLLHGARRAEPQLSDKEPHHESHLPSCVQRAAGDVVVAGENARRRAPAMAAPHSAIRRRRERDCAASRSRPGAAGAARLRAADAALVPPAAVALGTIGTGVAKQVRYKAQPTWATPPAASGAQLLRRVTSDLNKKKGTFESNEITSTAAARLPPRHLVVEGSINGELSPGTWKDFFAMALRRDRPRSRDRRRLDHRRRRRARPTPSRAPRARSSPTASRPAWWCGSPPARSTPPT